MFAAAPSEHLQTYIQQKKLAAWNVFHFKINLSIKKDFIDYELKNT